MKRVPFLLVALFCLTVASQSVAQVFLPPFEGFSKKKPSYLTMENGEEIECNFKKFSFKKGLIEEIKIVNSKEEKIKIEADNIKHMYIPPSGLAKLNADLGFITDADNWDNEEYEQEILGRGYAYFEKVDVQVKKKKNFVLMMQMLNPSFSSKIKVYHDPYAAETMSVGMGPISAGGDDKSYFILVNGEKRAYKMEKKDYDEKFKDLFGDCSAVMKKYGAKPKWSEFAEALHMYSTECN
ncbi:MAG: hypothetical protein AAGH79_06555 [Bacteroidota bacterium]